MPDVNLDGAAWPDLPWHAWEPTLSTVHRWLQIVGRVRMVLTPREPHWAHVPLRVTRGGLTTGPIPHAAGAFRIDLDFVDHRLSVFRAGREVFGMALGPISVARFYATLLGGLSDLGIDVDIPTEPAEGIGGRAPGPGRAPRDVRAPARDGGLARLRRSGPTAPGVPACEPRLGVRRPVLGEPGRRHVSLHRTNPPLRRPWAGGRRARRSDRRSTRIRSPRRPGTERHRLRRREPSTRPSASSSSPGTRRSRPPTRARPPAPSSPLRLAPAGAGPRLAGCARPAAGRHARPQDPRTHRPWRLSPRLPPGRPGRASLDPGSGAGRP